jgi:hypothetical protein
MVITGFLMAYNYIERKEKEPFEDRSTHVKFWLRRFYRLYPVYILAVTVAFFTFVPVAKINEANLIFFTGSNVSQWGTVRSIEQPGIYDLLSHVFMVHGLAITRFHGPRPVSAVLRQYFGSNMEPVPGSPVLSDFPISFLYPFCQ